MSTYLRDPIYRGRFSLKQPPRQCVAGSRKCNYGKITYCASFGSNRTAPTPRLLTLRIFNNDEYVIVEIRSRPPADSPTTGAAIDPDIPGCRFSTHVGAGQRNSQVSSHFPLLAAIPETTRDYRRRKNSSIVYIENQ